MSERLKPCPFCGGNAYLHTTGKHGELTAKCDACGVEITVYHDEFGEPAQELAIATWNKRATDFQLTSLQETNRRLVEALKPHMEILKDFEDRPDEEPASLCGPTGFGEREVSLGELRVARDLLSELEQDKSDD